MFGFFGQPQTKIIQEGAGVLSPLASPVNRDFYFNHGARRAANNIGRVFFDYDNSNAVKADKENLVVGGDYTGKPKTELSAMSYITLSTTSNHGGGLSMTGKIGNATLKYFRYTSTPALSPVTRKIMHELPYYDTKLIAFNTGTGNAARTDISNFTYGTMDLNLDQFPYIESVSFNESYLSVLNIRCSHKSLLYFKLSYMAALTAINGKLPSSLKALMLGGLGTVTSVTNLISDCANLETLCFGSPAGNSYSNQLPGTVSLTGTLDVSFMTQLKEFYLTNNVGLNSVVLPAGKTDWTWFQINGLNATAAAAFNSTILDNLLSSPDLRLLVISNCRFSYAKNIGNSEIAMSVALFVIHGNTWTGDISITASRPNLTDFRTSNLTARGGIQFNSHPNVNLTGLTNFYNLDLSGSNVQNLELPYSANAYRLILFDNKLDIVTNPDLLTQINALTGLIELQLGNHTSSINAGAHVGQTSVNGIGNNPDFSSLVNLTTLSINKCLITGTLTLPNVNKLTILNVSFNSNLVSIANLAVHTGLQSLYAHSCSSLSLSVGNTFTSLSNLGLSNVTIGSIDLSGKTTAAALLISLSNCLTLSTVTLPTAQANAVSTTISIQNCNSLTTINNLSNINYANTNGTNFFTAAFNPLLNSAFPLGLNNFIPNNIDIRSNGMSQANVDATIMNIHANRTKWDSYTAAKVLSIGGTNAAASGTYQAPVTAGSPATAKEAVWELINVKGWTITYN